MKLTISLLTCLLLLHSNVTFSASEPSSPPLEKVNLQLKWLHQFQFAGYYAAKEQGYYTAEGLDVHIFERSPDKDVVQQVVSGDRDFGVGDSGILSYYARGEPIVALAAIFQHNPLVDPLVIKAIIPIVMLFLLILAGFFYRRHTEHERAARLLRRSERRFRNTFEYAPIGILNVSLQGRFLAVNKTFCDFLGYSHEELLLMTVADVTLDRDKAEQSKSMQQLVAGEITNFSLEKQYLHKDGSLIWGNLSVQLSYHSNGDPDYFIVTVENIEERKQILLLLEQEKAKLNTLIQSIPDLIWLKNETGVYQFCNYSFETFFGAKEAAILGKTDYDFVDKALADFFREKDAAVMRDGVTYSNEEELTFAETGYHGLFETIKTPVKNSTGDIIGVLGMSRDISVRKQEEIELHIAATVFESQEGMMIADASGDILKINDAFTRITGYYKEDLINKKPSILHSGRQDKLFYASLWNTLRATDVWQGEIWNKRKNGEIYPEWMTLSAVKNSKGTVTHYVSTHTDITERKQIETAFITTKELAEASNQAKSDFLANMSHEIRTPMNGIIGLTQLVLDTPLSEQQRGYLSNIFASARLLLGIINDILDLSKIEAGQLTIEHLEFNLTTLLENMNSLFYANALEKRLLFKIDIDPNTPRLLIGDALRLQQVLTNLLSNAIKFTEQGSVRLSIRPLSHEQDKVRLVFSVQDTGMGMSEDYLAQLFEPFVQADSSITRRFGGTGLGLTISKKLLHLMGGEFQVSSVLGSGTTFSFELLLTVAAAKSRIIIDRSSLTLKEYCQLLAGIRLLVAEDNPINQMVIKGLLNRLDITVDMANNGREALQLLEQNSYDGVLMDMQMPVMGGIEATKAIRQQDRLRDLPVIALTAGATQEERDKCQQCGMSDFIAKPVDFDELVAVLCHWLLK